MHRRFYRRATVLIRVVVETGEYDAALRVARSGGIAVAWRAPDAVHVVLLLPHVLTSAYAHGRAAQPANTSPALLWCVAAAAGASLQLRAALGLRRGCADAAFAWSARAAADCELSAARNSVKGEDEDGPGSAAGDPRGVAVRRGAGGARAAVCEFVAW